MNHYEVSDLALAAYLSYQGFILKEIIGYRGTRRKQLLFEGKKDIEEEVDKFYAKKAKVCPLRYSQELKTIKSRLYEDH